MQDPYQFTPGEQPLDRICPDGGATAIFRTIACVGDSLSSGEFESAKPDGSSDYHDMFEYSWGQYLARMCGSKVFNLSRGGMTAKEFCQTFGDANRMWAPDKAAQAYIVALGVNEMFSVNDPLGTLEDAFADPTDPAHDTFAGWYGLLLRRFRTIQPRAKFFLLTMPRYHEGDEGEPKRAAHAELIRQLAARLDNTYVVDLFTYAPRYDEAFRERYFLRGHMNPLGYLLSAKMIGSYIDYIIRKDPQAFAEVGFIGTDLHG